MRAFRPSRFAPADEYEEEDQRIKAANLERYAKRAEKGSPLFERVHSMASASRSLDLLVRE